MAVGSIGGGLSPLQMLQSSASNTAVSGIADADGDNDGSASSISSGPAASASLSSEGQMLQKLKELKDSDPTKFKQVLTDMAKQQTV